MGITAEKQIETLQNISKFQKKRAENAEKELTEEFEKSKKLEAEIQETQEFHEKELEKTEEMNVILQNKLEKFFESTQETKDSTSTCTIETNSKTFRMSAEDVMNDGLLSPPPLSTALRQNISGTLFWQPTLI